jgi:predicted RNA-binding protein YlqC (UPF0109 family)
MTLALVDDHHAVKIDITHTNGLVTINLCVTRSDLGKVIGKQGRTARSLRTILGAAGMKHQRRYHLNIEHQAFAENHVS